MKYANLKKNFLNRKIIVTGCAAQINPKKYSKLNDVDFVIGNKEKLKKETWSVIYQKINLLR